MLDKSKPMTLGDIFSNTFDLIKETFIRNLVIASVFLIPTGIFMAYGLDAYFNMLSTITQFAKLNTAGSASHEQLSNLFISIVFFFFSIFVFSLGYLCALIGVTKISCSVADGTNISIREAFGEVFSITTLRCIGQIILVMLMIIIIAIFIVLVAVVAQIGHIVWLNVFGVLLVIAGIGFIIYLILRLYFAPINIIHKHEGVIISLSRSWRIVKDIWWRTFGIIMLVTIVIGFVSALITTPISFLFFRDFISEYFKILLSGGSTNDPTVTLGLLKSLGFAYGLIITLSTIIQIILFPLFIVVIYFDLRIRKNDFPPEIPEEHNLFSGVLTIE